MSPRTRSTGCCSTSPSRSASRSEGSSRRSTSASCLHRQRHYLGGLRPDLAGRAPPRHPHDQGTGSGDRQRTSRDPRRSGVPFWSSPRSSAGGLVYAQGYSTFPLWVRDRGFPERVYGFLQGSNGILVVVFELGVTAIAMRHARTRIDRPRCVAYGPRVRRLRSPPLRCGDGGGRRRVELRRDVRLAEHGRVHRGPRARSSSGALSELPRDHVRACVHDRADRWHGDLRMVAARTLDRLRSIGSARGRAGDRQRAVPGTEGRSATSGLTVRCPPGLYIEPIYRLDISVRYDEGKSRRCWDSRGPGSAQGAPHARLPALP